MHQCLWFYFSCVDTDAEENTGKYTPQPHYIILSGYINSNRFAYTMSTLKRQIPHSPLELSCRILASEPDYCVASINYKV